MFIDEAYSLAPRNNSGSSDSYSKEAIDFLNQFLSEHKDDLACIIAGYEKELEETIFSTNDGLKRRFPWKFVIEPYTPAEMLKIFTNMVNNCGYILSPKLEMDDFFKDNKDYFTFFGGDIETFITKCKMMHTRNTFGKTPDNIFTQLDIDCALKDHKKHKNIKDEFKPWAVDHGWYV